MNAPEPVARAQGVKVVFSTPRGLCTRTYATQDEARRACRWYRERYEWMRSELGDAVLPSRDLLREDDDFWRQVDRDFEALDDCTDPDCSLGTTGSCRCARAMLDTDSTPTQEENHAA